MYFGLRFRVDALLAGRPILAVFHDRSTVVENLKSAVELGCARVVTYDDTFRAESKIEKIAEEFRALATNPLQAGCARSHKMQLPAGLLAETLASQLAMVFDKVGRRDLSASESGAAFAKNT